MAKKYLVSYKTYQNERVGKIPYNGKEIHPLYIQLTFDRFPNTFKSYYFSLFCDRNKKGTKMPSLDEISKLEISLIDFIIQRNRDNFSHQLFKEEYNFYCRDILELMEKDFIHYMYVFLSDEGYPQLSRVIYAGADRAYLVDLIEELNAIFPKPLFAKLLANALHYAPPYLPLFKVAAGKGRRPSARTILPVFKWLQPDLHEVYMERMAALFPDLPLQRLNSEVEKFISS